MEKTKMGIEVVRAACSLLCELDRRIKKLDELIEKWAVGSYLQDCHTAFERLATLTEKKIKLINLSVVFNRAIQSLPFNERDVIKQCLGGESIAVIGMDASVRTRFRLKNQAVEGLKHFLDFHGFDTEYLIREYGEFLIFKNNENKRVKKSYATSHISAVSAEHLSRRVLT